MSNMYYCPNCGNVVSSEEGATAAQCGACGYQFAIVNPISPNNMGVNNPNMGYNYGVNGNYAGAGNYGGQYNYNGQYNYGQQGGFYNNQPVEHFNLFTAYISLFKKYAQFSGRSRRSEFWLSLLANYIVMMIMYVLMGVAVVPMATSIIYEVPPTEGMGFMAIMSIVILVYCMAIIIPAFAMCVRRLHDTGRSGWSYLLCLIPLVGGIILLVLFASDSQPGVNKYGPNPKGIS